MPLDEATRARVEKLPRHARDLIERLQRDLDYANERLAEGPADSDTFADLASVFRAGARIHRQYSDNTDRQQDAEALDAQAKRCEEIALERNRRPQ